MTLVDVGLFLLVFFITYLIGSIVVGLLHLATKNRTKTYRIAVIILGLLLAAMFTYNNLGREASNYPSPLANPNPQGVSN